MEYISTNPQPVDALLQAAWKPHVPTCPQMVLSRMHDRQKGIVQQLLSAAVQQGTGTFVAAVLQDIMSRQDATNKPRQHLLYEPLHRFAAAARVSCALFELWQEAAADAAAALGLQAPAVHSMVTCVAVAQVHGNQEAAAAPGVPAATLER